MFRSDWDADQPHPSGAICVFSHGCEIDKSSTILVAKVEREDATDAGNLGHIKRGRAWHALYLEDCAEPGWVNFRTIHPLPKGLLLARLDRRLHSMTDDARVALAAKMYSFLTRSLPPA